MDVNEHERLSDNTLVQVSLSIYLFAKYNKQGYNNNTLVKEQRVVRKDTDVNKGNNKITELRTILQRESQNSYVYRQTQSVNNRKTVKT